MNRLASTSASGRMLSRLLPLALVFGGSLRAAPSAPPPPLAFNPTPPIADNFWSRHVRKIHFDLHTDAGETELGRNFDPANFADKMARTGTQAVVFFSRCGRGHSYHPTKFNTPHPHLKSDLFGDVARELQKRGLGAIAYFHCGRLAKPDAEAHPDWLARGRDGLPLGNSVCPSSRFWEDSFIPEILEVAGNYPIGAVWIDAVYHWFSSPCFCQRCQAQFGAPLPGPDGVDPNWRNYDRFIQRLVWEKLNLCGARLHAQNPKVVLGSDWVGSPMWAVPEPEQFDFNTGDIRFDNGPLNAAFAFAAWTWRGKPADVNMQRTYWWQEFNTRSLYDLHREFATTLASGGTFMLGDTLRPFDMTVAEEQVRFYRDAFAGTARLEPIVAGARPRADLALLVSPEQLRVAGKKWSPWSPTPGESDPHHGTYAALAEAGLTAHILTEADLPTHLARYRALVLPQLEYVGSAAAAAIEAYVHHGGHLVLIGAVPAILDPDAKWTPEAAADRTRFGALAGLQVEGRFDYEKTFFHPDALQAAGLWRDDVYRLPVGVWGSAVKATLAGATALAPLAAPGRLVQRGLPMGEVLANPAFAVHRVGAGRVYFAAQPLASEYWKHGWRGAGCALQGLLGAAVGEPFARRVGGSMVQLLVTEKENQTALHLIAHLSDIRTRPGRQLSEPVAIVGPKVIVHTDRPVAAIRATHSGAAVRFQQTDRVLTVEAPPFTLWESLVIDWK